MPAKESKKTSFYFAWLAFLCAFEVSRNGAAKTSDDATKGFGRTSGFAFHLFKAHANPPVRPQAKIPRSEIRWLLTVTCQRVVVTSVSAVTFNPGHMKSDIRYVSWVTDNVHE